MPRKRNGPHASTGRPQDISPGNRVTDSTVTSAALPDRWHQLANAIQNSNLPASDKSVFRLLLDKADYVTADLPAMYTPTQQRIGRLTSHSLRQVKYALEHLERHGWVATGRSLEDKRRTAYTLNAGRACDCPGRRHVAVQSATSGQSATSSATEEKVQRRTSARITENGAANVANVADLAGGTQGSNGKVQPGTEIGATPAPYIGATDRCNAAGQTPSHTERQREGEVKEEKQEPVTLKLSPARAASPEKRACPRHDNHWTRGEGHPHCPACRALRSIGAGRPAE